MSPVGFGAQSGSTIAIVNADGTGVRAMTRAGQPIGGHAAPAWSPDGRFLAFTVFDNGAASGLWLVSTASGVPTELVAGAKLYEAAFAPDGSSIYAAGGGDAFISRIPFDAQKGSAAGPQTLMPIAGVPGVRGLSISRDGRRLWLSGVSLSSQLYSQSIDSAGTPVGRAVALTDDTSRRNSLPAISPDGSKVAYMSSRRGERPNVWLMDIDGGNPVQLTADETADNHPRWLPDGRRVAFLSVRDGEGGIWAIDVTTRREERLFDMTAAARPAEERRVRGALGEMATAPSMTRAAFSLLAPPYGHRALYVTGWKPFAPRALTDGSVSIGYPVWSPDERHLAIEIKDGSSTHAGIVDADTGAVRQLTHERGQTWVRSWSPDGRRIAVAALRDGSWSLRSLDIETGRESLITEGGPSRVYLRYPRVVTARRPGCSSSARKCGATSGR